MITFGVKLFLRDFPLHRWKAGIEKVTTCARMECYRFSCSLEREECSGLKFWQSVNKFCHSLWLKICLRLNCTVHDETQVFSTRKQSLRLGGGEDDDREQQLNIKILCRNCFFRKESTSSARCNFHVICWHSKLMLGFRDTRNLFSYSAWSLHLNDFQFVLT